MISTAATRDKFAAHNRLQTSPLGPRKRTHMTLHKKTETGMNYMVIDFIYNRERVGNVISKNKICKL